MSTAMERVMRERGDLQVFHEPFMHYYYRRQGHKEMPEFNYDENHPTEIRSILDMLLQQAQHTAVFAKDMSYYILDALECEPDLSLRIKHLFLIRDPRKSIMSYHKLDQNILPDEIGLAGQWQHFQWLLNNTPLKPLVVKAESVQADPKGIISQVWKYLDLPYVDEAFEWQKENKPKDWQQVEYWHQQVSQSEGIKSSAPEDDASIQDKFDQYASQYPELYELLAIHQPAYENLGRYALSIPVKQQN